MSAAQPPQAEKSAYHRIVDAEVAMEVINTARTKVMRRIYDLAETEPAEAERLRDQSTALYQILRSIHFNQPEHNADLIKKWSALLQDDDAFWATLNG
jgi:hypothetical protein